MIDRDRPQDSLSSPDTPLVTVVIPMRNEEGEIRRCLESVLANDFPKDMLEILVVDGISSDGSAAIVREYIEKNSHIRLLANPKRIQSAALNIGIGEAKGEIVVRMDAHSTYDGDYISRCVALLQNTEAVNVGGVQKAIGTTYLTRAIALVTTSRYGIGDAKFRYARQQLWADTVYLGAWWKAALESVRGFDESLPVNEDYELNYRLRDAGGKILFSPSVVSSYRVRKSLFGLAKQYARYGYWKVRMLSAHPESIRWRQMVPPVLVVGLLGSVALVPLAWQMSVPIPSLYLLYVLMASWKMATRKRYLPVLPLVVMTLHLSWGLGFLVGIFRWGLPRWGPKSLLRMFANKDTRFNRG